MIVKSKTENSLQEEALSNAQTAASNNEALEMLTQLFKSQLLEAYLNHFTRKYPDILEDDVYDIIAASTDELYDRVSNGTKITALKTYLYKIIHRKLAAFAKDRQDKLNVDVERFGSNNVQSEFELIQKQIDDKREKIETNRTEAIKIAESLLPRIGQVNVQAVMTYLFEAIKNGAEDVSAKEIADALHLTEVNVRQAMKRGFDRIARIFKEEKLIENSIEFYFLEDLVIYDESYEESYERSDYNE